LSESTGASGDPGDVCGANRHLNPRRRWASGAVRVASTSFGTTGWNGQIMDVAFRDPDGTTVLVAHNENDNPQTFGVLEGNQSFTYTLPGDALACGCRKPDSG
jgi:Glycosyl hydrolase family 30 beta sandwich domain